MDETCRAGGVYSATKNNCPQRRFNVNVRVVDGEVVVLDRQYSQIHQLNETASFIWGRCDGNSTVAEISHQYSKTFDVDLKTAAIDASTIIAQLQKLNLLEPSYNSAVVFEPNA